MRLLGRTQLVPLSKHGISHLVVGDVVVTILQPGSKDYIAGLCGLPMDMPGGKKMRWRVKSVVEYASALKSVLAICGSNRILMECLNWQGDQNLVIVKGGLAHSEMRIRMFVEHY